MTSDHHKSSFRYHNNDFNVIKFNIIINHLDDLFRCFLTVKMLIYFTLLTLIIIVSNLSL